MPASPHQSGPRSHDDPQAPVLLALDLTDTINFIAAGRPLGGIVRAVTQLVRHIARLEDSTRAQVAFLFHHPVRNAYCAVDPAIFEDAVLAEPDALLVALDLVGIRIGFTNRRQKGRLRRLRHRLLATMRARARWAMVRLGDRSRPYGWALGRWRLPKRRKVHVTALGIGWLVPEQLRHHARLARAGNVEIVPLIHDIIPIVSPEMIGNERFERWFAGLAALSTRYVTISRFSARDLEETVPRFGGRVDRVRPVPLAHEFEWSGTGDPAHVPSGDYVLSVGSLDHPRKNLDRLLAVWAALHRELGAERLPKLVLAGVHGKGVARADAFLAEHPELAGHVVLADGPDDAQLAALYEGCLFSVYPSLYEGWGLPVGESAWFGRLCIASNVTSVPEVLGEAADYFDPTSLDGMIAAIGRPIRDRAYLAAREQALRAVPLRRWSDVARDLVRELTA